jgi:type I restriction enzyme S subunit
MACEWETLPVAEAPLEIIDGDRGVNYPKQDDFGPSGDCLFLNTGNVTTTGFNFADRSFITKEKDVALRKGKLKRHDVVLTTRGTVGNVALFDDSVRFEDVRINSGMVLLRADQSKLLPRFLFQFLRSPLFKGQVAALTTGSAQPQLPIRDIRRVEVPLPPLAEQKAIAAVLGALDDKIELNRRMNATLESMARALFQSWFVDFDPVRAKLDNRQPTDLDKATADLFPATFQEAGGLHIPIGWTVEPVGEVVGCVGGGTPSTAEPKYWEGGTHHWTTPKDFSSLQAPILLDTDRKITDAGIAKISSGLLPAGTLLLSSRAPVGYLAIAAMPVAINQGFIAMKCNERASNYFMLNWCRANMAEIESRATGTTFAEISKQNFRPIAVVLPPKEIMAAFTTKVAPLYAQIAANLRQSRTLATLRDALLPKLLSGELQTTVTP